MSLKSFDFVLSESGLSLLNFIQIDKYESKNQIMFIF